MQMPACDCGAYSSAHDINMLILPEAALQHACMSPIVYVKSANMLHYVWIICAVRFAVQASHNCNNPDIVKHTGPLSFQKLRRRKTSH